MKLVVLLLVVSFMVSLPSTVPPVLCDKGAIPVGSIAIYQGGQLAVIAWKNGEEILIVSTSLYASPLKYEEFPHSVKTLYALEFLPLPSMPEMEEGDIDIFKALEKLVQIPPPETIFYEPNLLKAGDRAIEVAYHNVIGAHDVNVLKAENGEAVAEWVSSFLLSKGFPKPGKLGELAELIDGYLSEGYMYLVFDLVPLSTTYKTVRPLIYRFRSERIYYPLKASRIIGGASSIMLYILTTDRVKPESIEGSGLKIAFETKISKMKVEEADKRFIGFFSKDEVWLTVLTWSGYLPELTGDLEAEVGLSLLHLRDTFAFIVPVSIALALTVLAYIYEFRGILKKIFGQRGLN
ncbi:MAG: DUF2330 domain-containing protein [Candidatus Bathyarchaeia archaeon]